MLYLTISQMPFRGMGMAHLEVLVLRYHCYLTVDSQAQLTIPFAGEPAFWISDKEVK